jgi:hypothetical protein
MTRYWVVGLIVAMVALLFVVRRRARRSEADDTDRTLVPRGDEERGMVELDPHVYAERVDVPVDDGASDEGDLDDTAPAVLSPPEFAQPKKSVSNGSRNR